MRLLQLPLRIIHDLHLMIFILVTVRMAKICLVKWSDLPSIAESRVKVWIESYNYSIVSARRFFDSIALKYFKPNSFLGQLRQVSTIANFAAVQSPSA